MKKWSVSVAIVFNDELWVKDSQCDYEHLHTKRKQITVYAETPKDALSIALKKVENENWYSLFTNERTGIKSYISHTVFNDELFEKAFNKFLAIPL